MAMNNNSTKLLKFLEDKFGHNSNFTLDDYLHSFGNESDALFYSILYLPELVEIEDSIFLKRNIHDKSRLAEEIIYKKREITEIESSYNFIEVGYLFDCNERDLSDNEELLLAQKICEGWDSWLKMKYPNRNFIVEILSPSETGSTVGVHFFESRD